MVHQVVSKSESGGFAEESVATAIWAHCRGAIVDIFFHLGSGEDALAAGATTVLGAFDLAVVTDCVAVSCLEELENFMVIHRQQ